MHQPDGEVVIYLVHQAAAVRYERRAWLVTSPKGETHRVSELRNGQCQCSCPAWKYNRHAAGRWCDINGVPACKHTAALWNSVIQPEAEART